MNNAFIFETEAEAWPQSEYQYEDLEGDYESEYEGEGEYESDYEGDLEADYEDELEAFEYEDAEVVRDHRRSGGARGPMPFRPARAVMGWPFARAMAPRFRPAAFRFRPGPRVYRRAPVLGYRRGPWGHRRRPFGWRPGFGTPFQGQPVGTPGAGFAPAEGIGSPSAPSSIVMLLQRLLNQVMGANLPVDGVMNVETRSALRSFQSQPADASPPPPAPDPGAPPPPQQTEYDELEYLENEFDEFGY